MRVQAEFTTEPFHGESDPPRHATSALAVLQTAGLETDFGPLGTAVAGDSEVVVPALADVVRVALAEGATRITLVVERAEPERA